MLLDIVVEFLSVKIELLIMMVLMLHFPIFDHKDNKYHEVTLSASQFIIILLRHSV